MKKIKWFGLIFLIVIIGIAITSCSTTPATVSPEEQEAYDKLTEDAKECISCHADKTPGIVADWDGSAHAKQTVSCIDCHGVDANSEYAVKNIEGHEDVTTAVSILVPPTKCAECHEDQVAEFNESGHYRAHLQRVPKDSLTALVKVHEGQSIPGLDTASDESGCMQCHGTDIQLDENNRPTSETWPNAGMGNVYPDGTVGNCTVCHTRHSFSIEEARKPESCASCHLGPDHPDIEIYENSKHGHIYASEGESWKWDSPVNEWEPGDYRAPTCSTCHMSGIGDLQSTHNVTKRLYWNLWAKVSKVRNETDVLSPWLGDGEAGREEMKQVCSNCHSTIHTEDFFASGDKNVELYNQGYWEPSEKMRADLADKGLLKENPWADEFQILYYYIWHHDGRRARQGAMMAGPDWAHWHGFFELQQKLYRLEDIYNYRIETGEIGEP